MIPGLFSLPKRRMLMSRSNGVMGLQKVIEEIVDRADTAWQAPDAGKNDGPDYQQVKRFRAALVASGIDEDIAMRRARRATLFHIIYSVIQHHMLHDPKLRFIVNKFLSFLPRGGEEHAGLGIAQWEHAMSEEREVANMDGWQLLSEELQAYRNEKGEKDTKQAVLVLTDMIIWLQGPMGRKGLAILSAIDHRVSPQVKYQMIATVRQ
jgi:hypothetical protein